MDFVKKHSTESILLIDFLLIATMDFSNLNIVDILFVISASLLLYLYIRKRFKKKEENP